MNKIKNKIKYLFSFKPLNLDILDLFKFNKKQPVLEEPEEETKIEPDIYSIFKEKLKEKRFNKFIKKEFINFIKRNHLYLGFINKNEFFKKYKIDNNLEYLNDYLYNNYVKIFKNKIDLIDPNIIEFWFNNYKALN